MDMMNYPLIVRVGYFKGFCINSLNSLRFICFNMTKNYQGLALKVNIHKKINFREKHRY